jgi:ribosome modulation factor
MNWIRWRTECRLAHGYVNSMGWLHAAQAAGEAAGEAKEHSQDCCPHQRGTLAREWWFAGYAAKAAGTPI